MKLKKGLGLIHVFCIASGAMVSSGLFVLPGLAHAKAGPAVVLSYLLGGLLATAGMLSVAELATAMPKAGGDYFFIVRGMGPAVGTVAGLLTWFSLSLKSAFAIVGMAAFAQLIVNVDGLTAGFILCAVFVGLNLVGVKEAARVQVALVLALFALMVFYLVRAFPEVRIQHFEPFAPLGRRAIFSTAGFVFISYGGLLKISSMAEEIENPGRVIPTGLILSLLVVSLFYTLMVFVTSGVLGAEQLDHSLTPISDGAGAVMGRAGYVALAIAAILAFVSTANAGIMAASRYLFALSRDALFFRPFGKVASHFRTPYAAILLTGGVVAAGLFLKLDVLVEAASTVLILSSILSCLSIIVLRESGLQNYRPQFRAPLYPWIQLIGIVGLSFVLLEMGEEAFGISVVLILAGFSTYWFYGRKRTQQESALLHLIQRIVARELVTGALESELKEIIRERDEIVLDRFDRIVERSIVLDLDRSMSAEDFFALVADKMGQRLKVNPNSLLNALLAREKESSTVLSPGLAVPHILIEGQALFEILLARSRAGIVFSKEAAPVHSAFVLVGTRDERNFHLRALSAIAQIVHDANFTTRWLAARGEQALRDIVLLGERKRG